MTTTPRPEMRAFRSPRMPTFQESSLSGGLHVVAMRSARVPLVEMRLIFPLSGEQLLHRADPLVMSRSVLAGTERYSREELAAAFERLGGFISARVGRDTLEVSASALSSRLRDLLGLVCEVLTGAVYPDTEVRTDRARTADEIMILLSRPEVLADEAFAKRIFARHPYGSGIPRPNSLRRVEAPVLRDLHRAVFRPRAAHLVLVGDIQPRRALSIAEAELGAWLGTRVKKDAALPPLPPIRPGALELVDRPGSVQSNLRVGGRAPGRADPDWPATSLAHAIFGGMFTSRLVANLRERNGYTYSPRLSVSHDRAGSTATITAEVSTDVTAASLVETRYELGRIASVGVSDEELESARQYTIGSFFVRTATQAGLASTVAALARVGVGPEYIASHPKRLARATKAEVDDAARRYLAPASLATIVVGEAEAVSGQLSLLDEVTTRRAR